MLQFTMAGLFVDDIETMVTFYRDVMGMACDWTTGPYASLLSGQTELMMYGRQALAEMTGRTYEYPAHINGTLELAFDAGSPAAVDTEYARVVAAGAAPIMAPADEPWGQRTSYIADPDGNLIEIYASLKA